MVGINIVGLDGSKLTKVGLPITAQAMPFNEP